MEMETESEIHHAEAIVGLAKEDDLMRGESPWKVQLSLVLTCTITLRNSPSVTCSENSSVHVI